MLTNEQQQNIAQLLTTFRPFQPKEIIVRENSETEVILSFKLNNGKQGYIEETMLGSWDGTEYKWVLGLEKEQFN